VIRREYARGPTSSLTPFDCEENLSERPRGFFARPIPLQLAQDLDPARWSCAGLKHAVERCSMCLDGCAAYGGRVLHTLLICCQEVRLCRTIPAFSARQHSGIDRWAYYLMRRLQKRISCRIGYCRQR
jgi:hypothetical protein